MPHRPNSERSPYSPDSIHVIHLIFFFLLRRHRTTPRRIIKPAASERASELPCRTGRKDAAAKCGSSSGGEDSRRRAAPPLGKHDRQEKRHKIASSLSQNSDAGDDGIETTTADARIDANNMSMPCRDGGRSSRTPTEGRYGDKCLALPRVLKNGY